MTSMPAKVKHLNHTHLLTKSDKVGEFICDGCETYGSGKAYQCKPCDYDLHEYCATCPPTLPAVFIHPQHELTLYDRKKLSKWLEGRVCDICNQSFEGLFYRCQICDFNAHPYCTQFPQHVNHAIHNPAHILKFCLAQASECNVCHKTCQSWRYRCELCNYDIHVKCIMAVTSSSDQKESWSTTKGGLIMKRNKRLGRFGKVLEVCSEALDVITKIF